MSCRKFEPLIKKYDLQKYIEFQENNVEKQTSNIDKYLTWASNHESISMSEDKIPTHILPNDRNGEIIDLKIKIKRGMSDDEIYDQDKELRKKLARGNSILTVIDGLEAGRYMVLFALRKFTSKEVFDDDDRQDTMSRISNHPSSDSWKLYFTKPIDQAVSIVCTEKANGESAHLSCLYLENTFVIVAGSKNVHIAFTKREHIDLYDKDKYRLAKVNSHSIMDLLDNLPDNKGSENQLKFITWTVNDVESTRLTALPPDVSIDLARDFGLDCINYTKLPANDEAIKQRIDQVRLSDGHEGEVHYYLDSDGNTIGLAKVKSIWYILCRAIREKAKVALAAKLRNPSKYSEQTSKSKMEKRLHDIQSWLKFSDVVYQHWSTLSLEFLSFIVNDQKFSLDELANLFPLVWKDFLHRKSLTDRMIYTFSDLKLN